MKNKSGIVLTSGFSRAYNVVALAELLVRNYIEVGGILIVSPFSIKRLRKEIRRRGWNFIKQSTKRLLGFYSESVSNEGSDPILEFLMEANIKKQSLTTWANEHLIPYKKVKSINCSAAVGFVEDANPKWVVYGGGGIFRKNFINAANGRILNAHSGSLPYIRGMNACEWSLLLGCETRVTIHIINRGIDTGGVIKKKPVAIQKGDKIDTLRKRCIVEGIKGLVEVLLDPPNTLPEPLKNAKSHRQCFILAPALKEILQKWIDEGKVPGVK